MTPIESLATVAVGAPLLLLVIAFLVAGVLKLTEWIEARQSKRQQEIGL